MSKPHPPYYYNEKSKYNVYHWETSCTQNNYPNKGWIKTNIKPSGKDQCEQCKAK